MRRVFIGAGIILAGLVALLVALTPAPVVTREQIVQHCKQANPAWPSYQEDVKAQVGAGPVADWSGTLVGVRQLRGTVEAEFRIDGPWAGYECALPILMRDPRAKVVLGRAVEQEGAKRVYRFPIEHGENSDIAPWIELQWPHNVRRITFDAHGAWSAPQAH